MIEFYYKKVRQFRERAHEILSTHEASSSRSITVEQTYTALKGLSIKQDDLFQQAMRCFKFNLYRPAHVMAWAGFMDFIIEKLGEDGYKQLNSVRPKWNIKDAEDLRDVGSDFQVIETLQLVGISGKTVEKALKALLNKRNECAHPSDYYPGLNETLGYISEIIVRMANLQKKPIP